MGPLCSKSHVLCFSVLSRASHLLIDSYGCRDSYPQLFCVLLFFFYVWPRLDALRLESSVVPCTLQVPLVAFIITKFMSPYLSRHQVAIFVHDLTRNRNQNQDQNMLFSAFGRAGYGTKAASTPSIHFLPVRTQNTHAFGWGSFQYSSTSVFGRPEHLRPPYCLTSYLKPRVLRDTSRARSSGPHRQAGTRPDHGDRERFHP